MGKLSHWDKREYHALRECTPEITDNYVFSKIHKMCNCSLEYLGDVLAEDGEITIEQALTVFETLKYRIRDIFHKDIFIELEWIEERIQGKIKYKNEELIVFDFPKNAKDQVESDYIEKEKYRERKIVKVSNLEGEKKSIDMQDIIKEVLKNRGIM